MESNNSIIEIPDDSMLDGTPSDNEMSTEMDESTDDVYDDPDDSEYIPERNVPEQGTIQTRSKVTKNHEFQLTNFAFLSTEPLTVAEINKRNDKENWHEAMLDEMKSHDTNNTWNMCELPDAQRTVKCKWVFKAKKDDSGNVIRHKARLVAMGFSQRPVVDYNETFCPVVRYTSIRMLVAVAAK